MILCHVEKYLFTTSYEKAFVVKSHQRALLLAFFENTLPKFQGNWCKTKTWSYYGFNHQ